MFASGLLLHCFCGHLLLCMILPQRANNNVSLVEGMIITSSLCLSINTRGTHES